MEIFAKKNELKKQRYKGKKSKKLGNELVPKSAWLTYEYSPDTPTSKILTGVNVTWSGEKKTKTQKMCLKAN